MLRTRILVLLLIAFVLALLLAALNPSWITIEFGLWQWHAHLGVALGVVLALGILVGVMIRATWLTELLRERGRLRRALKAAEARAVSNQGRVGQ